MAWQDETGYGESRAPRAEVYDVTGAGDTVIAVLALAHAAALPLAQACHIASHAAALTVRVMGNYAPRWEEIEKSLGA
jgi:D-beta-D-heptose 7-phosphate kinase/D-beta-D-heptose 1-phosphate adenosyltransferase